MNSAIETTLLNNIKTVLSDFPEYWNEDTLLKNKVIDDLRNYDEAVITALLSNEKIKETYALPVGDMTIFKVDEFIEMLRYKNYWDNSYTKYRNEIGLTTDGKYLNYNTDVVLDFPFKDCVLEGGMSNEDEGKQEVYYHNVIAKEEIDTLFSPKVLTNVKKYDEDGEHKVTEFNDDDNLILKGNNLLALYTLKERYAGKVKLIYIDPPYNTGNDSFKYNDKFNRSTWLTFMKNRLMVAKELLSNDGSIYIQLDNNEVHYCKVLMDAVFGEENFQREIIWSNQSASGFKSKANNWIRGHDTILFYTKSDQFVFNKQYFPLDEKTVKRYDKTDDQGRKFKQYFDDGRERRVYLDKSKGKPMSDVWTDLVGFQTSNRGGETLGFDGQKSESLLQRILKSVTDEKEIVLDFFMGTATTQAVAMKMNRQFIGIEQMDYINTVSVTRLQKVIDGEQGGISKDVDWQGGGSFIYAELDSLNQQYIDRLNEINSEEELEAILEEMKAPAYLNFKVELHKVTVEDEDFSSFTLDKKKKVLIDVLDMNQLYLNYSEIDDTQYNISEEVKQFNHSFYNQGGA